MVDGTAGTAGTGDGGGILLTGTPVWREKSTSVVASGVPCGVVLVGVIGDGGDSVTGLLDASCRETLFWSSVDGVNVAVKLVAVVEVGFASERLGVYEGVSAAGEELVAGSRGVEA